MNIRFFHSILIPVFLLILPLTGWSQRSSDPVVSEKKPIVKPQKKPVLIEADHIKGYYKQEIEATGNAVLHHGDNVLTADRMKYYEQSEDTEVEGNIRLERPKDVLQGKHLELNMKTEVGQLTEPHYSMKTGEGRGAGDMLFFEGKDHYRVKETSYTTCRRQS